MFKWLKILINLSSEDTYLEKQEEKLQQLQETLKSLENQKAECEQYLLQYAELIKKTQLDLAALQ